MQWSRIGATHQAISTHWKLVVNAFDTPSASNTTFHAIHSFSAHRLLCELMVLGACCLATGIESEADAEDIAAVAGAKTVADIAPSAADLENFERKVRPLLHKHCYECHSANAKTVHGGLRLDGRTQMMRGGDSGPAVLPGKIDASLLITAVRYDDPNVQMPPEGRLSDTEISILEDWVRRGAPFPGSSQDDGPRQVNIEQGRQFWSFQPLQFHAARSSVPTKTSPWAREPIDYFVLDALERQGLTPSPPADRQTLIRRLTYDLTGLPPTREQIESYLKDDSPQATEELVERLLASPAYGERWARLWLDLARYTDATASWLNGTAQAHLYRDWVVKSLNDDLPYDEFIRRQLATDHLSHTGPEDLPALGFLGLSPTYWKELKLPAEIIKVIVADEWEERVDVVSRTFLGLTVACARCHDHKFDPITSRDYYALAGVFASSRLSEKPMISAEQYEPARLAIEKVAALEKQLAALNKAKPKPPQTPEPPKANQAAKETQAQAETKAGEFASEKVATAEYQTKLKAHQAKVAELTEEIKQLKATPHYDAPLAHVVADESLHVVRAGKTVDSGAKLEYREQPRDLPVFIRGNPNRPGDLVKRRFLEVLSPPDSPGFTQGSGRLDLANAITTNAAPLAARVIVNRIWLAHFGRGLVETPSNFGELGSRPSHPELLDDLAARFVANGWSIKWLHRELVLSATYQQTSLAAGDGLTKDPDNRWYWRMNRRRLDVEGWRDAMLFATSELDPTLGGPAQDVDAKDNRRRTLYAKVHRRDMSQMLQIHDFPAPIQHSPQRVQTTTPLQGLYVLNSPFIRDRAAKLAELAKDLEANSHHERIEQLHWRLFGRSATQGELEIADRFLGDDSNDFASTSWRQYTQSLLGCNEFLFVD